MSKRTTKETTTVKGGSGARSRTRERRQERQQQKRRQQQMLYVVGAVVAAVVILGIFILVNQPATAPIPEGAVARYEGIPQSTTDAGFPILGNPNAPVRIEEFSSFSCPGCAAFHENTMDMLIERVRAGVISFTYIPLTTGSIPNASGAAQAALCAGEQGAFYEFHDALFNWHVTYGNQAFPQNRLVSGIENLGLSRSQYDSCIGSSRPAAVMAEANRVAVDRGATSTPTIFVNGIPVPGIPSPTELANTIDTALAATGLSPVPLGPIQPVETTPEVEVTEEAEVITPEATEEVADETPVDEADADEAPEDDE